MSDERPRILVIKLGALGDVVQAAGPFAAIRAHHADADITLLTTEPFAPFLAGAPWFDEIWIDERPKAWQWRRWRALRRSFAEAGFTRVYDLQTSDRSGFYYQLMPRGTEWSGIVRGASHRHANPNRDYMHTIDRQTEQLAIAGIEQVPEVDFSWLRADVSDFALPAQFALLVPGGSAHRPQKRWPLDSYAALAWTLVQTGIVPVIVGGGAERSLGARLVDACGRAVDLTGRTSFGQIIELARRAICAVGNDTGPMHLIAAAGTPTTVLFSGASDPALCAPRGPGATSPVTVLRRDPLSGLSVNEVEATLRLR